MNMLYVRILLKYVIKNYFVLRLFKMFFVSITVEHANKSIWIQDF